MTDREQIEAIKQLTLGQIQEVRANTKPTYWIDGQRVHWEQYVESLQRTVDWCDQKLNDDDPYELVTSGGNTR
ncbi:hypothetical protein [Botrimarina hoheduenensis]|uniref:Uncharacterized protein n=1 Tax=Botrimarina hoheduenensis TaxID=2528000 RepID=A0A5C5W724_9BACT|nr:hypothetical protein [Botrimarina hoheduenensis]TWT46490.1 hypothetical protein Pla111_15860 [Botrimarina hoheduenensis]